ncbi:Hypothetical_protein [Hexamita inflata]|uniref:Hypothetical_protein n=1 Tax=Hexamita inflata TaxID=28002 RepID=A0AA86NY48_9EUKA|nr:Hypothetical protein HINF_LOCUS15769 [Hexamita inflata]
MDTVELSEQYIIKSSSRLLKLPLSNDTIKMRFMKCLISLDSFITACAHVVRPKKTCVRQTDALVREYTSIIKYERLFPILFQHLLERTFNIVNIFQNRLWTKLICIITQKLVQNSSLNIYLKLLELNIFFCFKNSNIIILFLS